MSGPLVAVWPSASTSRRGTVGIGLGVEVAGALLTFGLTRETMPWAKAEAAGRHATGVDPPKAPHLGRLARYMSWHDRSMLAVCQAGMANKFVDSLVIGFFLLYFLQHALSVARIGVAVGVYAWVWGLGQVPTGWFADRVGRKWPITAGTSSEPGSSSSPPAARWHGGSSARR